MDTLTGSEWREHTSLCRSCMASRSGRPRNRRSGRISWGAVSTSLCVWAATGCSPPMARIAQLDCWSDSVTTAACRPDIVWFVVYPEGPAQLTAPGHERSWISATDLQAEIIPGSQCRSSHQFARSARPKDGGSQRSDAPDYPAVANRPDRSRRVPPGHDCRPRTKLLRSDLALNVLGQCLRARWGWNDGPTSPLTPAVLQ